MNHLLQQQRRQQRAYFSTHSFCIMSQAAGGAPLTILMMLAEAINNSVTEKWLDFKEIVLMVAGRGMWGHHLASTMNLCALQQTCTATPEESDEGVYLGADTKESKDKQVKGREKGATTAEVTMSRAVEQNMKMTAAHS